MNVPNKPVYKKALNIKLILEESPFQSTKISCSEDAYKYVINLYDGTLNIYESAYLLCLNRANIVHSHVKISQGGIAGTVIDPKLVAKYAVDTLSSSIILVHNHPSGNIQPSDADKRLSKRIIECMKYFDIAPLDFLIVTTNKFYSFADNGIM